MFIVHCTSVSEQSGGKIALQFVALQPVPAPVTPPAPVASAQKLVSRPSVARSGGPGQYPGYSVVGTFGVLLMAVDAVGFSVGKEFSLSDIPAASK